MFGGKKGGGETPLGKKFFSSVFILTLSSVLVKVIGLFYKLPLIKILGAVGMGYFNCAYEIYAVLSMVATSGLPVALSILISSNKACGTPDGERRIYRAALILFSLIGALGTILMLAFSGSLADAIDNADARLAIAAISPSLFFVCVASVRRGYFQGKQNMTPTALSQLIEALFKIIFGVLAAMHVKSRGAEAYEIAAGAVFGASVGSLISMLSLFMFRRKEEVPQLVSNCVKERTWGQIVADIFRISVPITLSSLVMGMTKLADVSMIFGRLSHAGYSNEFANMLYGSYTTLAIPIFNLVPSLIASVALSLVPMLSEAVKRGDTRLQHTLLSRSLKLTVLMALPSSIGICVFSRQILSLLFFGEEEAVSIAAPLLTCLGISVLFSCLISYTNASLQAYGSPSLPIISMLVGGVLKIVSSYVLIGMPSVNIYGAPLGTLICNVAVVVCNFCFLAKKTGFSLRVFRTCASPAIAAFLSVAVGGAIYVLACPHVISDRIATLIAIVITAIVYAVIVSGFKIVKKEDLDFAKT